MNQVKRMSKRGNKKTVVWRRSGTEVERSQWREGTLSLYFSVGFEHASRIRRARKLFVSAVSHYVVRDISQHRVGAPQLIVPCARRFSKSLKWTLVQGMNSWDDSRLRCTHTQTHVRQTQCTRCVWQSTLRTQQMSFFVELAQFDTYQKLAFSTLHPRSCVLCFCEPLMLTKITVSRNEPRTEIWSDSRVAKKMSAVCIVSFFFITQSVIQPQLSGSYCWVWENDLKKQTNKAK